MVQRAHEGVFRAAQAEFMYLKLPEQPLSSTKLYDEKQNEISSMLDVFRKKSEEMFKLNVTRDKFVHRFDIPTFLKTNKDLLPYIKIKGVSTEISITQHEPIEREMKTVGFVNFILRNLQDGSDQVIPVEGKSLIKRLSALLSAALISYGKK